MPALLLIVVTFVVALYALLKGADLLLVGAKAIGIKMGVSNFIIGVLIVGFGTSLPELASSLAAASQGQGGIVLANIVGSNLTNILLIVGLMVFVGGKIVIKRNLLQTELPVFFIATVHFMVALHDGVIDRIEAMLLLGTFIAYLWYIFTDKEIEEEPAKTTLGWGQISFLVVIGITALIGGAHFVVESLLDFAVLTAIPVSIVSILALAIGTSLPELVVSLKSIKSGETELAIGNIFGSNAFNFLFVGGLSGLVMPLVADEVVMELGFMVVGAASMFFFVNGLTQRVMRFEGLMYLIFFGFFLVKLTTFF